MKATINVGRASTTPQPRFRVTYGTGGSKSPNRLRVMSLAKFYQCLVARHEVATAALSELWHHNTTYWEQKLQYERLESTFPFVVVGVAYDEQAALADEDDDHAGWQKLSGLVILTFKYRVRKGSKERIAAGRKRFQKLLLKVPLLGFSIVLMFKEPGECLIHVLVAAGSMPSYLGRIRTITKYLKAACPKLHRKLYGAGVTAMTPHVVGNDPQAWLRPRPAEGYALFPVEQARAVTKECEQEELKELARQRSNSRRKR